uniref:signal peptidase II n=1 Tax=Candidatus Scatomorpha intestinigallinarum TaxID=2840923 RepID=UPI0040291228
MFYAIAVVLVLIADQALKYWVSLNIDLNTGEQALIPGFIKLVNIHNSGAAFGLLGGGGWRWVFVVVALVFAVVVVYALKRNLIHGKLGRWAAVGVLAGSIGNCIDRVAYGYVVDMFKFEFLGDSRLNAIFNVADVFISCCGVLFCLYIIFGGENSLATAGEEDGEPAPKRRSGSHSAGSHSKKPQARRPAAKEAPRAQRPSAEPRTRIPVKEYSPRPSGARPARPVEPRAVDSKNPFAEWENAPRPAQPKPEAEPRPAAERRSAPEPRPARPVQEPRPSQPRPAPKPRAAETEFSLEDILAEFSDK